MSSTVLSADPTGGSWRRDVSLRGRTQRRSLLGSSELAQEENSEVGLQTWYCVRRIRGMDAELGMIGMGECCEGLSALPLGFWIPGA